MRRGGLSRGPGDFFEFCFDPGHSNVSKLTQAPSANTRKQKPNAFVSSSSSPLFWFFLFSSP